MKIRTIIIIISFVVITAYAYNLWEIMDISGDGIRIAQKRRFWGEDMEVFFPAERVKDLDVQKIQKPGRHGRHYYVYGYRFIDDQTEQIIKPHVPRIRDINRINSDLRAARNILRRGINESIIYKDHPLKEFMILFILIVLLSLLGAHPIEDMKRAKQLKDRKRKQRYNV